MLTVTEKTKILKYLNTHALGDLYYNSLRKLLNKKTTQQDILVFLASYIHASLQKENLQEKLILKMLATIYCIITEIGVTLEQEVKDQIFDFESLYQEYCNTSQINANPEMITSMKEIKEAILKLHPDTLEEEANTTIRQQQATIKRLNEKLEAARVEKEKLYSQKEEKEEELLGKNALLKQKYTSIEQDLKDLKGILNEKESQNVQLSEQISAIEEQKRAEEASKEKQILIEEKIIDLLLKSSYSLKGLQHSLQSKGYFATNKELLSYIDDLSRRFRIEKNGDMIGSPQYKIESPFIKKDTKVNIILDSDQTSIDLLFIADCHVFLENYEFYSQYDKILDYSVNNNISYILNLGDFFDFVNPATPINFEYYDLARKKIDELIQKLPIVKGIHHAILGGNHDEDSSKLGIDWLGYFTFYRDDFTSLGYNTSIINITSAKNIWAQFYLAHPNIQISERSIQHLKDYSNSSVDFQFYGHHHSSYLDLNAKACIVPSIQRDRFMNGAWHIKVNFRKQKIESIQFIPLVLEEKLKPTSRILYKK